MNNQNNLKLNTITHKVHKQTFIKALQGIPENTINITFVENDELIYLQARSVSTQYTSIK